MVIKCSTSSNPRVVQAALKLANAMLCRPVQDMFARSLPAPSSGDFFSKLKSLFHESKESIKEEKRRAKLLMTEKMLRRSSLHSRIMVQKQRSKKQVNIAEGNTAGGSRGAEGNTAQTTELTRLQREMDALDQEMRTSPGFSVAGTQKHMLDVLTMMRRFCRHSCDPLQNILREQRFVCVCVCVCVYLYAHVCTHACMHACMNVCMQVSICLFMCVWMCEWMCLFVCV